MTDGEEEGTDQSQTMILCEFSQIAARIKSHLAASNEVRTLQRCRGLAGRLTCFAAEIHFAPSSAFNPLIGLVDPELPFSNYFYRQLFSFKAVFETKAE